MILEDALRGAQGTISFLHNCLVSDGYRYDYPQVTVDVLKKLAELAPRESVCGHLKIQYGCGGCNDRVNRFAAVAEARRTLEETKEQETAKYYDC